MNDNVNLFLCKFLIDTNHRKELTINFNKRIAPTLTNLKRFGDKATGLKKTTGLPRGWKHNCMKPVFRETENRAFSF
jgi:hypothetical protein